MYGKRSGSLHGVAVTHRDKYNMMRSTRGWKLGVVTDVMMLGRGAMFKPEAP